MTSKFYDYSEQKIEMMAKWNAWLDQLADEARAADPNLSNPTMLRPLKPWASAVVGRASPDL